MEETKPLFRLLRTEAFRFIIVRYNHYSLVTRLKEDLFQHFPERPQNTVDARNSDYRLLVDTYYKAEKGFFFVENFDEVLSNPEIYSGLNQRRDKLALYPIALIVFISSSTEELFARQIMEKMPDLWSFRSLLLDLNQQIRQPLNQYLSVDSPPERNSLERKEKELSRLLNRITLVPKTEINFQKNAFEQIARLLVDLWRFDEALEYYLKLVMILIEIDDTISLGRIYNDIGLVYTYKKDFHKSLEYYHKSEDVRIKDGNEIALGTTYNNIGGVYSEKGEWETAYKYYQNAEQLFLTSKHDEGLGATYNNIGGYYIHNENWEKAISILLESEKKRLNCGDKKGLGVTYFNLGFSYVKLKDMDNGLMFYFKAENLLLGFDNKEMLKVLYLNIANIYTGIKDSQRALDYYRKLAEIEKKTGDKLGLGKTLNSMGIVTSDMGDFNKALAFHHQAEKIRYEISDDSGLIQTLYNIGMEWLRIKNEKKAIDYFTLAGYIAKKKGMDSELQKMDWAIRELIKKHGQDQFMKMGKKLYESWLLHAKAERKK